MDTGCPEEYVKISPERQSAPNLTSIKTVVSVAPIATYHSESNFKHADQFIPERHLGDPTFASDNKDALQPFSVGPRNCIGRK